MPQTKPRNISADSLCPKLSLNPFDPSPRLQSSHLHQDYSLSLWLIDTDSKSSKHPVMFLFNGKLAFAPQQKMHRCHMPGRPLKPMPQDLSKSRWKRVPQLVPFQVHETREPKNPKENMEKSCKKNPPSTICRKMKFKVQPKALPNFGNFHRPIRIPWRRWPDTFRSLERCCLGTGRKKIIGFEARVQRSNVWSVRPAIHQQYIRFFKGIQRWSQRWSNFRSFSGQVLVGINRLVPPGLLSRRRRRLSSDRRRRSYMKHLLSCMENLTNHPWKSEKHRKASSIHSFFCSVLVGFPVFHGWWPKGIMTVPRTRRSRLRRRRLLLLEIFLAGKMAKWIGNAKDQTL